MYTSRFQSSIYFAIPEFNQSSVYFSIIWILMKGQAANSHVKPDYLQFIARRGVLEPDRLIARARRQLITVGREGYSADRMRMPLKHLESGWVVVLLAHLHRNPFWLFWIKCLFFKAFYWIKKECRGKYFKWAIVNDLPKIWNKSANILNLVDESGSIHLKMSSNIQNGVSRLLSHWFARLLALWVVRFGKVVSSGGLKRKPLRMFQI